MPMVVELLQGTAVHGFVASVSVAEQWRILHERTPGATYFQTGCFVCTWYHHYRQTYKPVVVVAREADRLVGLWSLATPHTMGPIVHAGASQAEYHGWLAFREHEDEFVDQAFRLLDSAFPGRSVRLKYLPDVGTAQRIAQLPAIAGRADLQLHERMLFRVDPADVRASMAKKGNKSRFNRLARLGTLAFERVTSVEELEVVCRPLVDAYDFRQAATNGVAPFREDASKGDFHRELLRRDPHAAHLTVTKVGGRPIAGFWGSVSGKTLHLGMVTHSPTFAAHSPGKLHMLQVALHMSEEGLELLDLTPGGNDWKSRFANDHDQVAEVVVHASRWSFTRRRALDNAFRAGKRALESAGSSPQAIRSRFELLRRVRPAGVLRAVSSWTRSHREIRVYFAGRSLGEGLQHDTRVVENCLDHLLRYEAVERWQDKRRFLSSCMSRLEQGESVYTVVIDGRLAHFGWMVRGQKESMISEVGQRIALLPGTVTFYDFYTAPSFRGRGLYRATLRHMIRIAHEDPASQRFYIVVLADNGPSRHVIEATGFEYAGSIRREIRLGQIHREIDDSLSASMVGYAAT